MAVIYRQSQFPSEISICVWAKEVIVSSKPSVPKEGVDTQASKLWMAFGRVESKHAGLFCVPDLWEEPLSRKLHFSDSVVTHSLFSKPTWKDL